MNANQIKIFLTGTSNHISEHQSWLLLHTNNSFVPLQHVYIAQQLRTHIIKGIKVGIVDIPSNITVMKIYSDLHNITKSHIT